MKTVVNQLRRYLLSILLVCACIYVDAQSRAPIVGRVSDVKGEWMIGVSILEKGTSNGVITDINGQYSISTSSAQPTLVISYIGYKTQEVRIGKKVSIRPRACFFPLFSFLPLWLHYNLNPLCVQY